MGVPQYPRNPRAYADQTSNQTSEIPYLIYY